MILAWGIVEKIICDSYGAMLNCEKCGFWLCNIFDGQSKAPILSGLVV